MSTNNNPEEHRKEDAKDTDKDFPGYPHYPAKEDIMRSAENEQLDLDMDNLSRTNNIPNTPPPDKSVQVPRANDLEPTLGDMDDDISDDLKIVPGTDADVTKEDILLLKQTDGEIVDEEEYTGEDLDVPGAEMDDANEEIGEEDEENNYYSLGGDAHENLEEDRAGQ